MRAILISAVSILSCGSALASDLETAQPRHTAASAVDVCTVLLAKTRTFSDASQTGDGATLGPLLDDHVVFFNETGERSTKPEMSDSKPSAPTAGVKTVMTVTDWGCEPHGDIAVTSFIDDQHQDFHGQPFHARYRSVETWMRSNGNWRMIGSQTVALQDDPPSVRLSASTLAEYAGVFEAAPDARFTFSIRDGTLFASLGDGMPVEQKAEMRDVVFTPGHARARKDFQRDPSGRVVGFLLRREGHDIYFKRTASA